MLWMIIFAVVACALLLVAGFLLANSEENEQLMGGGIVAALVALVILSICSRRLYVKGVKRGYPTSLDNISSDQIYEFFGQIQSSKEFVVILENAEGRIRCVAVPEAIDPNTEYVKTATFEKEMTYKLKKKRLVPVSKE